MGKHYNLYRGVTVGTLAVMLGNLLAKWKRFLVSFSDGQETEISNCETVSSTLALLAFLMFFLGMFKIIPMDFAHLFLFFFGILSVVALLINFIAFVFFVIFGVIRWIWNFLNL